MKAIVEIETDYNHRDRCDTMLVRWRTREGEPFGYRFVIPQGMEPAYIQEPAPVVKKQEDFLRPEDRIWIERMMEVTR